VDSDHRLLRRAREGDVHAFEQLVREHQHRLYTLAARELGSAADADDAVEPADPRDRIAERELSGALQDALSRLDDTYRTPVLLYDVLGRSYAEIAELLGVAEGTVKSRIFRGRAELARQLGTSAGLQESNE
jgi:DNA-directed RNA polymerase specialized sigma24 family protein